MGSVHVCNLARPIPEANLAAICDIRLEVAQAIADELGIERVVKDYHELLADRNIDAVLIATSTETHAFIIKDVAEAAKHILCEKPLALDLASIDDALELVKKAKIKLQVGFNRRFDKSFKRVREIVSSGEISRPCILRITNRDPDFPAMEFLRVSGGMFLDMTIHDFDMARFLVGWMAIKRNWLIKKPRYTLRIFTTLVGSYVPLIIALVLFPKLEPGNPFFFISMILSIVGFHIP